MEPKEFDDIDLNRYWRILKRRWLPAFGVFAGVASLSFLYTLSEVPNYSAQSDLLFKVNRTSLLTGVGADQGRLETVGIDNNPLDTQAAIIRSVPIIKQAITTYNLRDEDGELMDPEDLAWSIDVSSVAGTDILTISYQAEDPELVAKVVNAVAQAYIQSNIQSNRAETASARDFIAQQLPATEAAVRQMDSELRRFKEENGLIVLEEEQTVAVRTINDLDSQITAARSQLADAEARSQLLRSRLELSPQQAVSLASVNQSPGVQEVLSQLQRVQQELTVQRTRYRPGHPSITTLERQVQALNELLRRRIAEVIGSDQSIATGSLQIGELRQGLISELITAETEKVGLRNRITVLSGTQAAYRNRANLLPKLEQTQHELERKRQAAQTTYESLLLRLQEIQVAENQNIGNARIIAPAVVPNSPIASKKKVTIAAGGIAGILLGIALAFTLDLLDKSVKTVKEARALFGYTLLGIIPDHGDPRPLRLLGQKKEPLSIPQIIVRDQPRSAISEGYQILQANLKFLNSDKVNKTIVVTSAIANEGKSEVAANLAAAIAQVGRRVLLVDADMRRPSQHHIWNLLNASGLSNVVVNQSSFESAVQEPMPNLHVLTSGLIPPNPMMLLDSKRMESMIADFADAYDFIIFDTPPLSGTADAAVLGKMADGVLLVARPGVVNSPSANAAKEFLTQSNQKVLGMVLNGVDIGNEPDSYFYHTGANSEFNLESSPSPRALLKSDILHERSQS